MGEGREEKEEDEIIIEVQIIGCGSRIIIISALVAFIPVRPRIGQSDKKHKHGFQWHAIRLAGRWYIGAVVAKVRNRGAGRPAAVVMHPNGNEKG